MSKYNSQQAAWLIMFFGFGIALPFLLFDFNHGTFMPFHVLKEVFVAVVLCGIIGSLLSSSQYSRSLWFGIPWWCGLNVHSIQDVKLKGVSLHMLGFVFEMYDFGRRLEPTDEAFKEEVMATEINASGIDIGLQPAPDYVLYQSLFWSLRFFDATATYNLRATGITMRWVFPIPSVR